MRNLAAKVLKIFDIHKFTLRFFCTFCSKI